MIDGIMAGDPAEYQARTPEEMEKYLQMVQSAVGYDAERGDVVQVENIQFDHSQLEKEKEEIKSAEQIELAMEVGKLVVGLIFLILFFTRVIRPIITWMTTTVEVIPETEQLGVATTINAVEEETRRLTEIGNETDNIRQSVNEFVTNDPKYTAGVIRKWMREKVPTAK